MCIPYFGIIKIAREPVGSKEEHAHSEPRRNDSAMAKGNPDTELHTAIDGESSFHTAFMGHPGEKPTVQGGGLDAEPSPPGNYEPAGDAPHSRSSRDWAASGPAVLSALPSEMSQDLQQNYQYPALIAGSEDWAFQGVDLAFFESLMRGAEAPGGLGFAGDGSGNSTWVWQG